MLYRIICCEACSSIEGRLNINNPRLMTEKPKIHFTKRLRFSFWSTIWPAKSAVDTAGITSIKPMMPNESGSLVIEYTCHSITINCIDQAKTMAKRTNRKILNSLKRRAAYGSISAICERNKQ